MYCKTEGCPNLKQRKGRCIDCSNRMRREKNADPERRERNRELTRKWRAANPEWTKAHDQARKFRKKPSKEQQKVYSLRHYYEGGGALSARRRQQLRKACFTAECYNACLALQDNKCAICKQSFFELSDGRSSACADHCHETKTPRGILCHDCNVCLGRYEARQRASIRIEPYEQYLENPPTASVLK